MYLSGSVLVNGNDLGSLSASIVTTPEELRVTDGRLMEKDGGGMQFTLNAPRTGTNNTTFAATLDRVNARTLIATLPLDKTMREQLGDTQSDVSGQIQIAGIPDAMSGYCGVAIRSRPPGRRTSGEPGGPRHLQRF